MSFQQGSGRFNYGGAAGRGGGGGRGNAGMGSGGSNNDWSGGWGNTPGYTSFVKPAPATKRPTAAPTSLLDFTSDSGAGGAGKNDLPAVKRQVQATASASNPLPISRDSCTLCKATITHTTENKDMVLADHARAHISCDGGYVCLVSDPTICMHREKTAKKIKMHIAGHHRAVLEESLPKPEGEDDEQNRDDKNWKKLLENAVVQDVHYSLENHPHFQLALDACFGYVYNRHQPSASQLPVTIRADMKELLNFGESRVSRIPCQICRLCMSFTKENVEQVLGDHVRSVHMKELPGELICIYKLVPIKPKPKQPDEGDNASIQPPVSECGQRFHTYKLIHKHMTHDHNDSGRARDESILVNQSPQYLTLQRTAFPNYAKVVADVARDLIIDIKPTKAPPKKPPPSNNYGSNSYGNNNSYGGGGGRGGQGGGGGSYGSREPAARGGFRGRGGAAPQQTYQRGGNARGGAGGRGGGGGRGGPTRGGGQRRQPDFADDYDNPNAQPIGGGRGGRGGGRGRGQQQSGYNDYSRPATYGSSYNNYDDDYYGGGGGGGRGTDYTEYYTSDSSYGQGQGYGGGGYGAAAGRGAKRPADDYGDYGGYDGRDSKVGLLDQTGYGNAGKRMRGGGANPFQQPPPYYDPSQMANFVEDGPLRPVERAPSYGRPMPLMPSYSTPPPAVPPSSAATSVAEEMRSLLTVMKNEILRSREEQQQPSSSSSAVKTSSEDTNRPGTRPADRLTALMSIAESLVSRAMQ